MLKIVLFLLVGIAVINLPDILAAGIGIVFYLRERRREKNAR
jgi:energy-coupling factor transporter transmembrane protein EcfT